MNRSFGGHSLTGRLRRVVVTSPEAVGWSDAGLASAWRTLGYLREPDAPLASQQHQALRAQLSRAGVEVIDAKPPEPIGLDAVYVRDASFITRAGAIVLNPGKFARRARGRLAPRALRRVGGSRDRANRVAG